MEDLLENGIPQNPEDVEDVVSPKSEGEEDNTLDMMEISEHVSGEQTDQSDSETVDEKISTVEITPKSLGVKPQRVRRNFSVRMKVTNDCIIVTVMRTDSDDTLTFVNNIRW